MDTEIILLGDLNKEVYKILVFYVHLRHLMLLSQILRPLWVSFGFSFFYFGSEYLLHKM